MEKSLAFAGQLLGKAQQAMDMAEHIISSGQRIDAETGRLLERLGQSVLIQTGDNREGIGAFQEKRRPRFD